MHLTESLSQVLGLTPPAFSQRRAELRTKTGTCDDTLSKMLDAWLEIVERSGKLACIFVQVLAACSFMDSVDSPPNFALSFSACASKAALFSSEAADFSCACTFSRSTAEVTCSQEDSKEAFTLSKSGKAVSNCFTCSFMSASLIFPSAAAFFSSSTFTEACSSDQILSESTEILLVAVASAAMAPPRMCWSKAASSVSSARHASSVAHVAPAKPRDNTATAARNCILSQ